MIFLFDLEVITHLYAVTSDLDTLKTFIASDKPCGFFLFPQV